MRLLLWAVFVYWHTTGSYNDAVESNHLNYYETLSQVQVLSQVKRSSTTQSELVKRVKFSAFGRNFHLTLKSGSPVLSKDYQARLIHKDGTSTSLPLDQSKIFTGHNRYNRASTAHAHLEDSLWSIRVIEDSEIYAIEPAWRILNPTENPHNDTMVAYRMSDLKGFKDRHQFCNVPGKRRIQSRQDLYRNRLRPQGVTRFPQGNRQQNVLANKRGKRSTGKRVCLIYLVGDTEFYKKRCKSKYFSCLSLMIQHLQFADSLYTQSSFEDRIGRRHRGIGLQIAGLIIFKDYTTPNMLSNLRHFNEKFGNWTSDSKLRSFAKYMGLSRKRYCLNHLFTELPDKEGVLGLAYVDQLCRWQSDMSYNSGLTSGTNKIGILLPSLEISLVMAHEIGHNFGASHDPDTPECAPEDIHGGKFLMWPYAVDGKLPNNRHFSRCSLRRIGRSVPATCFTARSKLHSFCGNGIIDAGEECDAGFFGSRGDNKCCTKECTLKPGAWCSEINHECCDNCQIAPKTTVCDDTIKIYSCKKRSYCSGTHTECLDGGSLPDGSNCGEMHKCYDGVCMSPCEQERRRRRNVNLKPCQCTKNATEACMWCCFDATDPTNPGECKPLMSIPRNNGTACYRGSCENGVCLVMEQTARTRLTTYIDFVKRSNLDELLTNNIVLIVVTVSLVLWIPAALYISFLDAEERHMNEILLKILQEEADSVKETMAPVADVDSSEDDYLSEQNDVIDNISMSSSSSPWRSSKLSNASTLGGFSWKLGMANSSVRASQESAV